MVRLVHYPRESVLLIPATPWFDTVGNGCIVLNAAHRRLSGDGPVYGRAGPAGGCLPAPPTGPDLLAEEMN
jgi:hypothetical protein